MVKDHLSHDEQNYYVGLYNAIPAFICCCFQLHFGLSNILYILYAVSNGIFIFYSVNALQIKVLEFVAISKFIPLTYLAIVFIFFLGVIVLGKPLFFSDIIGVLMIIRFQFYNIYFPPGRKISDVKKRRGQY